MLPYNSPCMKNGIDCPDRNSEKCRPNCAAYSEYEKMNRVLREKRRLENDIDAIAHGVVPRGRKRR